MENKSLSVVTVTFNAEKTLERTLENVLGQTWPHIEHIVADGNSTDGTIDIVRRHERPQLKWTSEPDDGLYDAMNKGAAKASGDYLCFLNAGDKFHARTTVEEMMLSLPEGEMPDILYGETDVVDDEGTFLHPRRLRAPERLQWESFRRGMLVCHQAFIVRRDVFERYDLSFRFSSDVDWCIRMMKKAHSIYNTHHTLIDYLNEGMTTANRKASLIERFRIMRRHYGLPSTLWHHAGFVWKAVSNVEK